MPSRHSIAVCHNLAAQALYAQSQMTLILSLWTVSMALMTGPFQIRAIDGTVLHPLEPSGVANVLFFVSTDCPVANGYAPEIQRICGAYAGKGIACSLVY